MDSQTNNNSKEDRNQECEIKEDNGNDNIDKTDKQTNDIISEQQQSQKNDPSKMVEGESEIGNVKTADISDQHRLNQVGNNTIITGLKPTQNEIVEKEDTTERKLLDQDNNKDPQNIKSLQGENDVKSGQNRIDIKQDQIEEKVSKLAVSPTVDIQMNSKNDSSSIQDQQEPSEGQKQQEKNIHQGNTIQEHSQMNEEGNTENKSVLQTEMQQQKDSSQHFIIQNQQNEQDNQQQTLSQSQLSQIISSSEKQNTLQQKDNNSNQQVNQDSVLQVQDDQKHQKIPQEQPYQQQQNIPFSTYSSQQQPQQIPQKVASKKLTAVSTAFTDVQLLPVPPVDRQKASSVSNPQTNGLPPNSVAIKIRGMQQQTIPPAPGSTLTSGPLGNNLNLNLASNINTSIQSLLNGGNNNNNNNNNNVSVNIQPNVSSNTNGIVSQVINKQVSPQGSQNQLLQQKQFLQKDEQLNTNNRQQQQQVQQQSLQQPNNNIVSPSSSSSVKSSLNNNSSPAQQVLISPPLPSQIVWSDFYNQIHDQIKSNQNVIRSPNNPNKMTIDISDQAKKSDLSSSALELQKIVANGSWNEGFQETFAPFELSQINISGNSIKDPLSCSNGILDWDNVSLVRQYTSHQISGFKSQQMLSRRELTVQLNREIHQFEDEVNQYNESMKGVFDKLINQVSDVISQRFPGIKLHTYGSYATQLCLPWSDIDIVLNCTDVQEPLSSQQNFLKKVESLLIEQRQLVSGTFSVSNTAVPVLKVTCTSAYDNKKLDITILEPKHNGLKCVDLVNNYIAKYRLLRPLVLVMKQFLNANEMNDTYKGGLSSYSLILMLVFFLQLKQQFNEYPETEADLMIQFLVFYGFDEAKTRIIHPKIIDSNGMTEQNLPNFNYTSFPPEQKLIIIDPHFASNNVARSTFHYTKIKTMMACGYSIIFQMYQCAGCKKSPTSKEKKSCLILKRFFHFPGRITDIGEFWMAQPQTPYNFFQSPQFSF